MPILPDVLCHYYEAEQGPLRNLSDLPPAEAEAVLDAIRSDGEIYASRRAPGYLSTRGRLEERVRTLFVAKGGRPQREAPHYFTLGPCRWVRSWYRDGRELRIPLRAFDPLVVSFTYGDLFPAMRYQDGKPYRGQVYTLEELPELVRRYGLPQEWNPDGKLAPERYIEAQVWDDGPLEPYLEQPGGSGSRGLWGH